MNWQTVNQAVELVKVALCGDKDLPVRVEAAIAIQMLISEQEKAKAYIQPFVKPVILELLNVIRETENDELTGVMQKLVCTYVEDVTPIAVDMMTHLAQTFAQIIESDSDGSEEKAISALGILNTMETILSVMEDQKEIVIQLEGIILQNNIIGEVLSSDEDEIDEASQQYLERLEKSEDSDSDGELTDDGAEETALESYMTTLDADNCPVDEYVMFKNILTNLPNQDGGWYQSLVGGLNPNQMQEIEDVFKLAEQRKAVSESKKIEEGGGYSFNQRQVPSTFNFGSG